MREMNTIMLFLLYKNNGLDPQNKIHIINNI